ncbi:MAG: type I glutamate--ammonia ligase [bacterium]
MAILLMMKKVMIEKNVKFLDVKYCDLWGRLRHITTPIEQFETVMASGIGFDSSSVAGFGKVEGSDMILKPDLNTAFVEPFSRQPTVSCFSEIYETGTGKRYDHDPRFILEKAIMVVKDGVGCDEIMVRPEFEFYLFNSVEFWSDESSAVYRIETDELRHDDHSGLALFKGSAYEVAPPFDQSSDFRSELVGLMADCGIDVKYHHHEGGRFSQVEVEPVYMPAFKAGDGVILTKYLIRNLAFRYGKSATFMPKPIFREPGSGMHIHLIISRRGVSLFGDKKSPNRLSQIALYFIGGIIGHLRSLCAFTNPSTNSYRRLVPGYEAPTEAVLGVANRTAAIRIPGYLSDPNKMAIEFRVPDATANPYLALAAILLAGWDGIKKKLDLGRPVTGMVEAKENDSRKSKSLPNSLMDALIHLSRDSDYLRESGVFKEETIQKWINLKMQEVEAMKARPHPWEFNLYYSC